MWCCACVHAMEIIRLILISPPPCGVPSSGKLLSWGVTKSRDRLLNVLDIFLPKATHGNSSFFASFLFHPCWSLLSSCLLFHFTAADLKVYLQKPSPLAEPPSWNVSKHTMASWNGHDLYRTLWNFAHNSSQNCTRLHNPPEAFDSWTFLNPTPDHVGTYMSGRKTPYTRNQKALLLRNIACLRC